MIQVIIKYLKPSEIYRIALEIHESVDWFSPERDKKFTAQRKALDILEEEYKNITGNKIKYKL